MKMTKKILSGLPETGFVPESSVVSHSHLSETETQDNVSMIHFKNTLTACERQVGRGGNTQWQ
ncbi:MAG: hypothetical protein EOL90_06095 [Spartobacteria bacterium]|nr:hypothetical protein [Spartobacteria bacterium]